MIKKTLFLATFFVASFLAAPVLAIEVNPGHWEWTTTVNMPMFPQPQQRSHSQCVTQTEFNPEDLSQQDVPCEFTNVENAAEAMSWDMVCSGPQGEMTGNWAFTAGGDSLEGSGAMNFSMQGQEMKMTMAMTGVRTGDCEGS